MTGTIFERNEANRAYVTYLDIDIRVHPLVGASGGLQLERCDAQKRVLGVRFLWSTRQKSGRDKHVKLEIDIDVFYFLLVSEKNRFLFRVLFINTVTKCCICLIYQIDTVNVRAAEHVRKSNHCYEIRYVNFDQTKVFQDAYQSLNCL